jgi:hypothetical protein
MEDGKDRQVFLAHDGIRRMHVWKGGVGAPQPLEGLAKQVRSNWSSLDLDAKGTCIKSVFDSSVSRGPKVSLR